MFIGIAIFQIVYIGYHYLLFKRKEFFAYLAFTILISFFAVNESIIGINRQVSERSPEETRAMLLHVSVLILAGTFYLRFTRYLMDAIRSHPTFNKVGIWSERFFLICLFIAVPGILLSSTPEIFINFYSALYMIVLPAQLYMLFIMIRHRTTYTGLVTVGSITLMLSLRFTITKAIFGVQLNDEQLGVGILSLGIALNFLFVNLSLIFRSKEIQNEKLNLEIEKRDELNRQRMTISNDLHDDAGASLSSLYLYSNMAEVAVGNDTKAAQQHLARISSGLRQVMENMNDIVWAVSRDDGNDKLFSSRIKDFAYELSDATGISMHYEIDLEVEQRIKAIPVRRNLMLVAKEALNNAMKHSGASRISVVLQREEEFLRFSVSDDGIGFDPNQAHRGHGLITLKTRAESVGGKLKIETQTGGKGTTITFFIPLARISD